MNREISIKDLQQLSEYLDGKLREKERIQVEARLRSQPELREELEGLRRTHLMLQQLPRRRAPRNFFITPEMLPKRSTLRLFPVFRLASALAGLLLVVAFAGDLLFGFAPQSAAPAMAPFTLQAQQRNSSGLSESNPPIIMWGTPTPGGLFPGGAGGGGGVGTGMGGGVGSSESLPSIVASENSSPAPLPEGTPPPLLEGTPASSPEGTQALGLAVAPTSAPSSEAVIPPSIKAAAPQNNQPAPTQAASAAQDQYQSGPVLGVNPTEGAAEAEALNHAPSQPFEISYPTLHIVEGALALVAVLAGLAAFFFYRRENL
jgi:hypothetical protein